jgi:hypothetical protein
MRVWRWAVLLYTLPDFKERSTLSGWVALPRRLKAGADLTMRRLTHRELSVGALGDHRSWVV